MRQIKTLIITVILIATECVVAVFAYKNMSEYMDDNTLFSKRSEKKEEKLADRLKSENDSLIGDIKSAWKDLFPEKDEENEEYSEAEATVIPEHEEREIRYVDIPDLVGSNTDLCRSLMTERGIKYNDLGYFNEVYDIGIVMWQSIDPYSRVPEGSELTVWVSLGPDPFKAKEEYTEPEPYVEPEPYPEPYSEPEPYTYEEDDNDDTYEDEYPDETDLCKLAGDHYYRVNGDRPPCVRVDSFDGDIVIIHMYEVMEDHDVTWDWYYINRVTGETTTFWGESFNIFYD